jgi:hypothetical protein
MALERKQTVRKSTVQTQTRKAEKYRDRRACASSSLSYRHMKEDECHGGAVNVKKLRNAAAVSVGE